MKPGLLIAVVLVVTAAGGYAVYLAMQEESPGALDAAAGAHEAELALLRDLMRSTAWVADPAFDEGAVKKHLAYKKVALTPELEAQVLPLLRAHLQALRANLQAASDAAGSDPAAERTRFVAAAARANKDFQDAVRKIVPDETATALFHAVPSMIPPPPADEE